MSSKTINHTHQVVFDSDGNASTDTATRPHAITYPAEGLGPITDGDAELDLELPADADDPTFFVLDTGGPEPPGMALVLDEDRCVSELRFDRMVRMLRNDRLDPWS